MEGSNYLFVYFKSIFLQAIISFHAHVIFCNDIRPSYRLVHMSTVLISHEIRKLSLFFTL
jgi:hypothetical protein